MDGTALHRTVIVRGDRIAEVVDAASAKQPRGSQRIEGRGLFLILDADPIDDIRNVGRIRAVISNGIFLDRRRLDRLLATAERMAQSV